MILLITLTSNALASDAVGVKKGEEVPFDGILLTYERAAEATKNERKLQVLKDLRVADKELVDYHIENSRQARLQLREIQIKSYLGVVGAFLVGAVVTSIAFKVNQKIGDI